MVEAEPGEVGRVCHTVQAAASGFDCLSCGGGEARSRICGSCSGCFESGRKNGVQYWQRNAGIFHSGRKAGARARFLCRHAWTMSGS